MKIFRKLFTSVIICCLALIATPEVLHAQISDPSCDPVDPACPIDGGVTVLLAAGIGYGIKKVKEAREKEVA